MESKEEKKVVDMQQKKETRKEKLSKKIRSLSDKWVDLYITESNVLPQLTETNIKVLLEHRNIKISYDEIKRSVIYDLSKLDKNRFINNDEQFMSFIEDEIDRNHFQSKSFEKLYRKCDSIAYGNTINPIKEYLKTNYELNKDKIIGTEFIDKMFKKIKIDLSEFDISYLLFRRWIVSCVASQFETNFISHGALTFTGNQGSGKSTWLRNLVPEHLKDNYFKGEFSLDVTNKDSIIESTTYWITELAELGSTTKKENDKVKSHITKQFDEIRTPYARKAKKDKRRTVYCASVDKDEFLRDDVNRRWWTIKIIDKFDNEPNIDIDLFWSEVMHLYLNGEKWFLSYEEIELLNKHNQQFNMSNEVDSMIQSVFSWDLPTRYYLKVEDIFNCLPIKNNITTTKLGLTLKKMAIPFKKIGKNKKAYEMPKVKSIAVREEIYLNWTYEIVGNKNEIELNYKYSNFEIESITDISILKTMQDEEYSKLLRIKNRIDELSKPIDLTSEKNQVEQGDTLANIIVENSKPVIKYTKFYTNVIDELQKYNVANKYKDCLVKLESLAMVNNENFKLKYLESIKNSTDKFDKLDNLILLLDEDSTASTIEPSNNCK